MACACPVPEKTFSGLAVDHGHDVGDAAAGGEDRQAVDGQPPVVRAKLCHSSAPVAKV